MRYKAPTAIINTGTRPSIEPHFCFIRLISFQVGIGIPQNEIESGIVYKDMSEDRVPPGNIFLGQLNGRTLPVAAAKFAIQLQEALDSFCE